MPHRRIIIDTDPGIDDAVAILLALGSPELEVAGLVAVAGNLGIAPVLRNAGAVTELAGRGDIPVYAGCPRPIGPLQPDAAAAHGEEGLGNLVLPPPAVAPRSQHGVAFLIETLRDAEPHSLTLCALGPLTNIATALVMGPDITRGVAELVIMGGGSHGNVTPAAEFNIHADPQAARVVFDSLLPITLVPLDVTEQVRSTAERIAMVRAAGTRCAEAVAELLSPQRPAAPGQPGRPAMAMHDPCVIAYLLAPGLFSGRRARVAIETASPLTLGMTVIDRRSPSPPPPHALVLETVDVDGVYRLLAERMARLP
ncbi:MAG TPA: nucleoside hydrolase [Stellaceae bacterium]|jgi:purine nucleosidase|nr:nucleoside hydrolase [Stellaceae bacterium]